MTKARRQRLREAREWFPAQGFSEDSHIVKAYRERFGVDKDCAMRELCLLGVLSPKKQKAYEGQLKKKTVMEEDLDPFQDENFSFIAGYTSGGAPYGSTWEEWNEEPKHMEIDGELPF